MAMCAMAVAAMQGGAFTFLTSLSARPADRDHGECGRDSSLRRKVATYQKNSEIEALVDRHLIGEDQANGAVEVGDRPAGGAAGGRADPGRDRQGKEVVCARLLHDGARGATSRSWRKIARPCLPISSRASCSGTRPAPSPAPAAQGWANSNMPTAGPFFSTRWRACRWRRRPSCCASCRSEP